MSIKVLGLVNCYTKANFGPMTQHRSIASASFLGRYSFIDFPLSNFINSNFQSIGILCQNHIRSLTRHVGTGLPWIKNSKINNFQILYNEPNISNPSYNTDVANLIENKWYLKECRPDYVVISHSHFVFTADFKELLNEHIKSGARISVLYKHCTDLKHNFVDCYKIDVDSNKTVSNFSLNRCSEDEGNISLGTVILDYSMLEQMISYASTTSSLYNLIDALNYIASLGKVKAIEHKGYAQAFDSFKNYFKHSLELLDPENYSSLFKKDWPIFTKSFDTPPAFYHDGSVKNSFIANGAIIEGTVENSIIGRGVVIKKDSVVKNSIILSSTFIDKNSHIENAVIDKEAQIIHISNIVGTIDDPIYIARGDII